MDTGPPLSRRARESAPGLQSDDGHLMPLLPFGPDGVREPKPSGTWDPSKLTTVVGSLNKESHGRTTLVHGLGENRSAPLSAAAPVFLQIATASCSPSPSAAAPRSVSCR